MKQHTVNSSIFKDPESASRLQRWLENSSKQQRSVCLKLLSSLSGTGGYGGTRLRAPSVTSRPSTASGWRGTASLTADGQKCSLELQRPQTANPKPNKPQERPKCATKSTDAQHSEAVPMHTSAWMTMNDQFYGFRKLYPNVYNTAAQASRAVPAPNMLFSSEYADSLKVRLATLGKCSCWQVLSAVVLDCCRKAQGHTGDVSSRPPTKLSTILCTLLRLTTRFASLIVLYRCQRLDRLHWNYGEFVQVQMNHQCFFSWMQRQRLYYGDLFTDATAAKMDHMLRHADKTSKQELLQALRLLYAALQPDRCSSVLSVQCACKIYSWDPCHNITDRPCIY